MRIRFVWWFTHAGLHHCQNWSFIQFHFTWSVDIFHRRLAAVWWNKLTNVNLDALSFLLFEHEQSFSFKSLSHSVSRLFHYICNVSSVHVYLLFSVSIHRSQTFSGASLHVPERRKDGASKTYLKQLKQQIAWSWCHTLLHAGEDTSKLFYCVAR